MKERIDRINELNKEELAELIGNYSEAEYTYALNKAQQTANEQFGKKIYVRGLIEYSNICKNDCLYCGIRCSNHSVERYRLTKEEILSCCEKGYECGIRTFVLQGGEDLFFNDEVLCDIIKNIHEKYPDCAITLSSGERDYESYRKLFNAGADRYLLRHETANEEHYGKLHPHSMSFNNRIECLKNLKKIGYQTGCGMMIGSPYQTAMNLAEDVLFMRELKPEMIGIGPFLPQSGTPFGKESPGSVGLTLFMISILRLQFPKALIPSTTALGSAENGGRIRGILAGANVFMPNLSPKINRSKYLLYDGKASLEDDAEQIMADFEKELNKSGYHIYVGRGDYENTCGN